MCGDGRAGVTPLGAVLLLHMYVHVYGRAYSAS